MKTEEVTNLGVRAEKDIAEIGADIIIIPIREDLRAGVQAIRSRHTCIITTPPLQASSISPLSSQPM